MKALESRQNPELKRLARLMSHTRERRESGLMVIEGLHLVGAALDAEIALDALYVNAAAEERVEVQALLSRIARRQPALEPRCVPESALAAVTALTSPAEVLAVLPRPQGAAPVGDFAVFFEDVQDPGNLGTLLRASAAAGASLALVSKTGTDPFSPKVLRAGMGAHFVLPIRESGDLPRDFRAFAGKRLAAVPTSDSPLWDVDLTRPVALAFGNEGQGLSPAMLAAATSCVTIPMPGSAESLNVAMAATVCLFEVVRQRRR